jgi:hypothetical protein
MVENGKSCVLNKPQVGDVSSSLGWKELDDLNEFCIR